MKRRGNLYSSICSIANLMEADRRARKGKRNQPGVIKHDRRRGCNILTLHNMLADKTYRTSAYNHFKLCDPKPRDICSLPYWPDRIAQHAIMVRLESIFTESFTADTYSCIKGKGVHAADQAIVKMLRDTGGTEYCLKLDVRKFYPSIDHDILKALLRRKFKDAELLWLLDEIIDSAPGVPIGNYLSQYFANYYLSGLDHLLKETLKVKYYVRYADDLIIFSSDKPYLHRLRCFIQEYLQTRLNLAVKGNYQVSRVDEGIDVLGYVYYHTHKLLRKRNKKNFARAMRAGKGREAIAGHLGLAKHCNSRNLIKKLTNESIQRAGHKVKEPDRREIRNNRDH